MDRIVTVIPVYNGERFLPATLDSVAKQTVRPDRLVVIDDCSTDRTRELVQQFRGFPCELRVNETRQGLFQNLNRALTVAPETENLHILLADDLILPQFFERVLPPLHAVPGRALSYSLIESIDEHGTRLNKHQSQVVQSGIRKVPLAEFLKRQCELSTIICGSIVLKTLGQPSPVQFRLDMPQTGDCVFYAEWGAQCTERIEIREVLCQIRYHPFSATSQNVKKVETWVMDEWKAISAISDLMDRSTGASWLQREKLKCLFAARSHVKIGMTRHAAPDFARQIREASLGVIQRHHWALGGLAVKLRDSVRKLTQNGGT